MASDIAPGSRAFPLGLTFATAAALSLLVGLGVWQLQRLQWKERLLSRIEALRTAPAAPLGLLLATASKGGDLDFSRAQVDCTPDREPGGASRPSVFRYALHEGQIGWRVLAMCRLAGGPFDGILLDRGLEKRLAGAMAPLPVTFPQPVQASGVLRRLGSASPLDPAQPLVDGRMIVVRVLDAGAVDLIAHRSGMARPAPYFLAVEVERPAPQGVVPAALPSDIPNNHFSYALTWFALAGVLAWFYLAMLRRRLTAR